MKRRTTTTETSYNGKSIMTDDKRNLSCDTKILNELDKQFKHAEATKSKTFFMRMDVRLPEGYNHTDNKLISNFHADLTKTLKRQGLKPQYLTVREQSKEKHQHYHCCLWLDGKKTQNIHNHIQTAERVWRNKLGIKQGQGLVDDCTKSRSGERQVNGVMLYHKDEDYEARINDCFRRASYLAKVNTKANTPAGEREIFSSRITTK